MQKLAPALRLLFAAVCSRHARQLTLAQTGASTLVGTVTTIAGQPVTVSSVGYATPTQTVGVGAGPTAALTVQLPASTTGLSVCHLKLAFWVRNAFDRRYIIYGSLSPQAPSYLQSIPRLLGTTLPTKFYSPILSRLLAAGRGRGLF